MQQLSVQLADAAATQNLGRQLALDWLALPQPRPILLLEGDLGAGKTSLVQWIALALEIDEPITSPTFALAQHYQGQAAALVHLDLYRLEQSASADELFCQEEEEAQALGALMAVEWPGATELQTKRRLDPAAGPARRKRPRGRTGGQAAALTLQKPLHCSHIGLRVYGPRTTADQSTTGRSEPEHLLGGHRPLHQLMQ